MRVINFLSFVILFVSLGCNSTNTKNDPLQKNTNASTLIDISVEELVTKINNDDFSPIWLDVRTASEIENGAVDNSLKIDFRSEEFESEIKKLDPNKEYLVYCASGVRSKKTQKMMHKLGFKSVYNLKGGFNAWSNLKRN